MANLKAAKKSIKQDKKKRLHNAAIASELKTFVKKLNILIDSNKAATFLVIFILIAIYDQWSITTA